MLGSIIDAWTRRREMNLGFCLAETRKYAELILAAVMPGQARRSVFGIKPSFGVHKQTTNGPQ